MGRNTIIALLLLSAVAVHANSMFQTDYFPSTIDGFSFFLVFDTPILLSGTVVDASRYNLVWGASDAILPMYRNTNPSIIVSHYIPWSRDPDGTHDLAYWQATKPEWVVYQCDKVTPAFLFNDPHIPLDISNPEVIDWQLDKYTKIVEQFGYNGIAADNFAVGNAHNACGIWKNGVWVAKYDGRWEDPNYTVDALNWITTFYARLRAMAPDISFGINYSLNEMPPSDARVMSVVDHTDYVLDEAGFTKWGMGKPTPDKWDEINTWIENIQNEGKHYFGINEFPDRITNADHEWGMASYLMSKNHGSTMVNTVIQGYGIETYLPNYVDLNIGEPIGKRYLENGLWKRRYSNGFVIVNVYNDSKTVSLPDNGYKYKDVFGNTYGPEKSFTVNGQTGLVMGATQRPPTTTISSTTTTSSKSSSSSSSSTSSSSSGDGGSPVPQNPSSTSSSSSSPSTSGVSEDPSSSPSPSSTTGDEPSTSGGVSLSFSSSLLLLGGVMWMLL